MYSNPRKLLNTLVQERRKAKMGHDRNEIHTLTTADNIEKTHPIKGREQNNDPGVTKPRGDLNRWRDMIASALEDVNKLSCNRT